MKLAREKDRKRRLDHQKHPERRDKENCARRLALPKRTIQHTLDHKCKSSGAEDPDRDRDVKIDSDEIVEIVDDVSAEGRDRAVRKVEKTRRAVEKIEPKRDECVDGARNERVQNNLRERVHEAEYTSLFCRMLSGSEKACRRADRLPRNIPQAEEAEDCGLFSGKDRIPRGRGGVDH